MLLGVFVIKFKHISHLAIGFLLHLILSILRKYDVI